MASALSVLRPAWRDTVETAADYERWATLAWTDTALRYRRTVIGPWWVTLSSGVFIATVGLVWGGIFGTPLTDYMPYFAAGYVVWTLISATVTEGCSIFITSGGLIKSTVTPLLIHVWRMIGRNLIVLGHNLIIIVLLWLVFRWSIGWSIFLAIPGMALLIAALAGAVLTFGVLCTRFRDIQQIIGSFLQLMFLLTPIMWNADLLAGKRAAILVDYNPLHLLIEVVRGPILGNPPSLSIWIGAALSAAIALGLGLLMYGKFRHRIAYWL
jgi:lipopolysaccharide transport system permease protein